MKTHYLWVAAASLLLSTESIHAQYEWSNIAIPASAGSGKTWDLVESMSDDFNYNKSFSAGNFSNRSNFGARNQWYNFYHNAWDGPGRTYWNTSNVAVDGDNLVIKVGYTSRNSKGGAYGVQSGCVASNSKVTYPVYVESSVSVANISLASCFWLLSPDDTQEIDIIENYGDVNFFKNFTHISHHSFVRNPFTDYQPRDRNSWYRIQEIVDAGGWGSYCWNNGNRRYLRMGVNWVGPKHFEYFINGELVRVMYSNAMATKIGNQWQYTYYTSITRDANNFAFPKNGGDGYSLVTLHATTNNYSFDTLKAASDASFKYSVIDTGWFQGADTNDLDGNGITNEALGFTKELDIIINMESQSWLLNETPSQADLNNPARNQMNVDWVRVYKPVNSSGGGGNTGGGNNTSPPLTCDTAPDYNGNANSYSPGDRVVNTNDNNLYERTATGWNLIENCGGNTGGDNNGGGTSDGSFYIINRQTKGRLSANGTANFSNLLMADESSAANATKWTTVSASGDYFFLRNEATGMYFRPQNSASGSVLQQVPDSYKGTYTQWKRVTATGGFFYLENRATGMYFRPESNTVSSKLQLRPSTWRGGYTQWQFIDVSTGAAAKQLEDVSQIDIHVYPNPVNSGEVVTLEGVADEVVQILDFSGKVLQDVHLNKGNLDTSNLVAGIYFVIIDSFVQKLIVK